jgi:hypothetical protein
MTEAVLHHVREPGVLFLWYPYPFGTPTPTPTPAPTPTPNPYCGHVNSIQVTRAFDLTAPASSLKA